jgi:hypothetical protein
MISKVATTHTTISSSSSNNNSSIMISKEATVHTMIRVMLIMKKVSMTIKKEIKNMKEGIETAINVLADTLKIITAAALEATVDITVVITVVAIMEYTEWKIQFILAICHKRLLKKSLHLILDQLVLSRLIKN